MFQRKRKIKASPSLGAEDSSVVGDVIEASVWIVWAILEGLNDG